MEYQFKDEVRNAKRAAMGEMFHLAKAHLGEQDRLINFASGHPSTEVFQDAVPPKGPAPTAPPAPAPQPPQGEAQEGWTVRIL